jgi:hypothetical protein
VQKLACCSLKNSFFSYSSCFHSDNKNSYCHHGHNAFLFGDRLELRSMHVTVELTMFPDSQSCPLQVPWPESASKLCWPSDCRLLAKLVPNLVAPRIEPGTLTTRPQRQSSYPLPLFIFQNIELDQQAHKQMGTVDCMYGFIMSKSFYYYEYIYILWHFPFFENIYEVLYKVHMFIGLIWTKTNLHNIF